MREDYGVRRGYSLEGGGLVEYSPVEKARVYSLKSLEALRDSSVTV